MSEKSTDEKILIELQSIREQFEKMQREEEEKAEEVIPEEEKEVSRKAKLTGFFKDFVEFLKQYQVIGLAVAFIMAEYVKIVVNSLVNDIILPIFLFIPGLKQLESFEAYKVSVFMIGSFISSVVTFIIIAFVIYLLVKVTTKLGLIEKKE
ncbi:MAG: MscL family protein [Asgard group archaeon]|nr:MscL family protein [Asgard group archaeon]